MHIYIFDLLLLNGLFILVGLGDPILIVISSIIAMAHFRVRMIVFQPKMLANLMHAYKSTLLSAPSRFTTAGEVAVVGMLPWTFSLRAMLAATLC